MSKNNKAAKQAEEPETTAPETVETQTPEAETPAVEAQPEEAAGAEAAEPAKAKAKLSKKQQLPDFMAAYVKSYPGEKVFHVTSDRQVFLDKDYHLAKMHQRSLGKGEIKTYNV